MTIRIVAALTIVPGVLCILEKPAGAQNLRELARVHAVEHPGATLEVTGPPGDYRPKDIEQLAAESEVVLRGRLVRIESYLGRNDDRILTDYRIGLEQLLTGSLPPSATKVPDTGAGLRLTVYGGELPVEGVLIRARDPNLEEIVNGRLYLLFLVRSRSGEAGSYEIHYGGIFDVSTDRVRPLLRQGNRVFKGTDGLAPEDLIRKVKMAGREPPACAV